MKQVSISTRLGVSKLIYEGMALAELSEEELESLKSDIWVALMEMDLAKEMVCQYEKEEV